MPPDAQRDDRPWLQRITSDALKYQQFNWDEVKVHIYGDARDAAVVTGRQAQKVTYQGRAM